MARRRGPSAPAHVTIDVSAVAGLMTTGGMEAILDIAGRAVATEAKRRAPRKTGAGARSIRHHIVRGDRGVPEARISWDRDHYYMRFAELGTSHQPARPFLRPALSSARI